MQIILEGSAKELVTTFEEFRKRFINTVNDFSSENSVPDKPEAIENTTDSCYLNHGFFPGDKAVNEFMKAQAKFHRQVRRQLHSSLSEVTP